MGLKAKAEKDNALHMLIIVTGLELIRYLLVHDALLVRGRSTLAVIDGGVVTRDNASLARYTCRAMGEHGLDLDASRHPTYLTNSSSEQCSNLHC